MNQKLTLGRPTRSLSTPFGARRTRRNAPTGPGAIAQADGLTTSTLAATLRRKLR